MKAFYQGQDTVFRDQIVWMDVFLDGPNKITPEEKQKIKEVLIMYGLDRLWDENPRVQQDRVLAEAKGQLKEARSLVETLVNARFPALTDLAHQKVASTAQLEALHTLLAQIGTAPNEEIARRLLLPLEPS
jgi:hypothetical protein